MGLLQHEGIVELGKTVLVFQMGPPLAAGQPLRQARADLHQMEAHLLAWLDDLTPEQILGMEDWLEEVRIHLRSRIKFPYCVHPAYREEMNEDGTMVRYRRFSCAGFVERCYFEGAKVTLVVEADRLPEVPFSLIDSLWGASRESQASLESLGLKGAGPWRLLLPGYLIHAMSRAGERGLPYQPQASDCDF